MWFKTSTSIEAMSVEGIEHSVDEGYMELPDNLTGSTVKFLTEHGCEQVPESEVPDRLKGPKLPPVFEDAGYPLPAPKKEDQK
ncbi:MAG: hypothetical protein ABSC04_01650 [Syntrophobacteraceae bacterium]|jgi:hypothetical protein